MKTQDVRVQAILVAGDRGAARAVRGESKAFVEAAGRPMVVHVLEALLHTPEISEVYVAGNATRLEKVISDHGLLLLAACRSCPVHIVPQRSSLYENIWHTFLRTLPAEGPREDHPVFIVPADIPLVVPEELSEFIRQAASLDADYALGITPQSALLPYEPRDGQPGIRMACFNMREGRFRQNNLHYVRPLRFGNRKYIQDVYENRYQKEFGNTVRLGWRILRQEYRHLWVLFYYALMHLGAMLDWKGYGRLADRVRSWVPMARVERGISGLLQTRFRTLPTAFGGAALDVDNDHDLEIVDKMLFSWKARQARLARLQGAEAAQSVEQTHRDASAA